MRWIHSYGAPETVYNLCYRWVRFFELSSVVLLSIGIIGGLFLAPMDYQQQDAFRIIYIHVPAALGSMALFSALAIMSFIYLVWRIKVAAWLAQAIAPVGALYTALALITGAIWGKPMWGAWWVWDARLTSELILLFLYFGYMGLYSSFSNKTKGSKAAAIFAIIAWIDIPIIHYSVKWWQTLHQGSTLIKLKPSMSMSMLWPLIFMMLGFALYSVCIIMHRVKIEILHTQTHTSWLKKRLRASL